MAEKDPGLHKDIASIFQDLSVEDKEQQKPSVNDESEQDNNIFSELLTPSHLVSDTDESQQQQTQNVQEQTEPSVDSSDSPQQNAEQQEQQNVESVSEETAEDQAQTETDEKTDDTDKTPTPEIIQTKVAMPQPVKQLSGVRKILQDLHDRLLAPKPGVDPKRQKLMIVLVPALLIIFVVVLTQILKSPVKNNASVAGTDTPAVIRTSKDINWQMPEPYPENLRDPMKAGTVSSAKVVTGDIVVRGILFSQDNPSALIAEDIVHEGDQVFGATIMKINKDNVQFERDGQTWTQKVQR
ncbi:MAG: hypothetical protein ACYSSP_07200 [Planctomycetota bacterium]|jgi:hypothetical protein